MCVGNGTVYCNMSIYIFLPMTEAETQKGAMDRAPSPAGSFLPGPWALPVGDRVRHGPRLFLLVSSIALSLPSSYSRAYL